MWPNLRSFRSFLPPFVRSFVSGLVAFVRSVGSLDLGSSWVLAAWRCSFAHSFDSCFGRAGSGFNYCLVRRPLGSYSLFQLRVPAIACSSTMMEGKASTTKERAWHHGVEEEPGGGGVWGACGGEEGAGNNPELWHMDTSTLMPWLTTDSHKHVYIN